jgi:hypothetical protein
MKRLASVRVVLLDYGRGEARANTLNAMLNFGREHRLSPSLRLKDQRDETGQCGQQVLSRRGHLLFSGAADVIPVLIARTGSESGSRTLLRLWQRTI